MFPLRCNGISPAIAVCVHRGLLRLITSPCFCDRAPTDPPLLSKHKISHWDTQLEVLGWAIDSVAMAIALTKAKAAKLRGLLLTWPRSRRYALESEVRELVGNLLYDSEVVLPGKVFVLRMLNQLGLPPVKRW